MPFDRLPPDADQPMPPGPGPAAPDISVVIAAWRDKAGVRRAIASALSQRDVTVEVIVVDDASPDATGAAARAFASRDARVRVLTLAENGGPGAARNAGFAAARGDWIAVLDSDDAMAPGRLRRMIDLGDSRQADLVLGNLMLVRELERPDGEEPFLPDGPPARLSVRDYLQGNLRATGGRPLGYLKPLVRRAFAARCGLRYDETLRNGEDCHLVLSAYAADAVVWLYRTPDYLYQRRAGSLSARSEPEHLQALLAAEQRIAPVLEALPGQGLRRLLAVRRKALARVLTTERAMRALKARQAGRAAGLLLRHPAALPRLFLQLSEAASKRLPRTVPHHRPGLKGTKQ